MPSQRLQSLLVRLLGVLALSPGCSDAPVSAGGGTSGDGPVDAETGAPPDATTGTDGEVETGSTGGEPEMSCTELDVAPTPLRRLTRQQYANAVRDVLGVTVDADELGVDEKAGAFDSNGSAAVSSNTVELYRVLAESVAVDALVDSPELFVCEDDGEACWNAVLDETGRRLFRRPLTEVERERYLGLAATADSPIEGARLLVQAMLQSPSFLYHLEFGLPETGDIVPLTDYELASRLSFFLWNSVPDDALLDAAADGQLSGAEGLVAQAERLLGDPRARESVASFHVQWLGLDHLEDAFKDPGVYPEFTADLADAMVDETRRFTSLTVLQGDGRLETLLTASHSYLTDPLFELYGVDVPEGFVTGMPVELDPQQRAGIITHAAFLTEHALTNQSGPIQRGVEIRNQFFCDPPPPPPPDANVEPPAPDPDATTREIFEQHTADPTCASCHVLIDGIGLGMENYDGVGRYRTTENGKPVDATGELLATDVDGPFDGGVELAHQLAQSEQVRECVARQWFRFAFGRLEGDGDTCSLDTLHVAFADADYDVRAVLIELVRTDAFLYRRK